MEQIQIPGKKSGFHRKWIFTIDSDNTVRCFIFKVSIFETTMALQSVFLIEQHRTIFYYISTKNEHHEPSTKI